MTQDTLSKNKITCTVTGVTVSVAPKVFDARALKFGSADLLRNNYIGSVARKLLCSGRTVDEIRAQYNVPDTVSKPSAEVILKYTKWAKYRKTNLTQEIISTEVATEETHTN